MNIKIKNGQFFFKSSEYSSELVYCVIIGRLVSFESILKSLECSNELSVSGLIKR